MAFIEYFELLNNSVESQSWHQNGSAYKNLFLQGTVHNKYILMRN